MITHTTEIKLFTGNSNKPLAEGIAKALKMPLGDAEVGTFSDGASAGRITAVMPYFGYARQDRKAKPRDPITAKLVADLIQAAGADRLLTMDLHAQQIQGFFDIPVDHLVGGPLLYKYFKKYVDDNFIVVSPDVGSVARARNVASKLNCQMAIIDKRRPKANQLEVMNIIGDVNGKTCLMVDDMIDTAGTIVQGAEALYNHGAKRIIACCTHAVFSGPAIDRIKNSHIEQLVVLDTIQLPEEKKIDKIKVISVADIFSLAIDNIYNDKKMSESDIKNMYGIISNIFFAQMKTFFFLIQDSSTQTTHNRLYAFIGDFLNHF